MLRNQLVEAVADRLDAIGWTALQRIGRRLPRPLQPPLAGRYGPIPQRRQLSRP